MSLLSLMEEDIKNSSSLIMFFFTIVLFLKVLFYRDCHYFASHLNKYSINTMHSMYRYHEFVNSLYITKVSKERPGLDTFGQIVEECFIGDKDEEVSYSRGS